MGSFKTLNKCGCNYKFKIHYYYHHFQIIKLYNIQSDIRPLDSFICINTTQRSWYVERVCFSQQIIIGIFIY